MAGTLLLDGLVRADVARELTYSARIFDGREAAALGFATHLAADPRSNALELARTIAKGSPAASRATKRLFAAAMPYVEARLLAESREQQPLIAEALQRIRQQRG